MSEQELTGVYQLKNGYWGYRFVITVKGKKKAQRRVKDENGNPYKTMKQAMRARAAAMQNEHAKILLPPYQEMNKKTVEEVYDEYCEKGRSGKAYTTIKKQDSMWLNHLKARFGSRYIDEITTAEIQDYLDELYYVDGRAYTYVESFLKMFYLIFGQAYTRNYLDVLKYNRLCVNKETKIHMPKMKVDEDTDIKIFTPDELRRMDEYFRGSNAETAYLLGKYCGLRINECYGLKWSNIDFENGLIVLDRQMQYQEGLIKLVPLKTRNAKRKVYMNNRVIEYMKTLYERRQQYETEYALLRRQNQTIIQDIGEVPLSSLELVNTLPNGKIQTLNSMKYHSRTLQSEHNIQFKYHWLRHTYGTKMAVLNTPMHLLCNQMGHASSKVTQKYYVAMSEEGIQELKKNINQL